MDTKRILLVEDDASIAFLIKEHLGDLGSGYEVGSASSGEEALRQFEQGKWDLVVTDYRMPGITGLELIASLRDKAPTTLTVLITGYGSDEVRQEAQRLNVYHYMPKPFPLADLSRVIKEALSLKSGNNGNSNGSSSGNNGGLSAKSPAAPPPAEKSSKQAVKVVLAGDGAVGKSSLIYRLCTERFDPRRKMTIGVEFHIYDVSHDISPTRLIVWDVGGQDHFAFTRRAFYRGSKAVGLVYDASDRKSFERLPRWKSEIGENLPRVPLVLAANKTDLSRQVSPEEGQALAATWQIPFYETSCVSGKGVREFFSAVASAAMQQLH